MIKQQTVAKYEPINTDALWRAMRWIIPLAASAAILGCDSNAKPAVPPPPRVSVVEVKPGPLTVYDEFVGQTQAPDTIEIRSQVTGLLERKAFVDGARVKKGDVLYVIDQRPFQAQLQQAGASLTQAQASLLNAQQNLARNSRLIEQKAVSQQDFDSAFAQEHAAAAQVEAQKALVRNAELNLEYTTLRAPRDGFISNSQVKPGALVTAQQTLLTTLYSSDPMWVNFTVSEYRFLEVEKQLKRILGEHADDALLFRLRLVDGTDYPPSIRNVPFTNTIHFSQFNSQQPTSARTYFSVNTGPRRWHRLSASGQARLRRRDDRPEVGNAAGANLRPQPKSGVASRALRSRDRPAIRERQRDPHSSTGGTGGAGQEVRVRGFGGWQGRASVDRGEISYRERVGGRQRAPRRRSRRGGGPGQVEAGHASQAHDGCVVGRRSCRFCDEGIDQRNSRIEQVAKTQRGTHLPTIHHHWCASCSTTSSSVPSSPPSSRCS